MNDLIMLYKLFTWEKSSGSSGIDVLWRYQVPCWKHHFEVYLTMTVVSSSIIILCVCNAWHLSRRCSQLLRASRWLTFIVASMFSLDPSAQAVRPILPSSCSYELFKCFLSKQINYLASHDCSRYGFVIWFLFQCRNRLNMHTLCP